jgi:hypothetical protein
VIANILTLSEVAGFHVSALLVFYSETARMTTSRKPNTLIVIASICIAAIPATILTSF